MKKYKINNYKINIIIIIIIIYLIWYLNETEYLKENPTLEEDGFVKLYNIKKEYVLNYLPKDYVFIDYKYTIKGCTLSTFHRDVTSSQYIFNTKYPVYTYIKYYNDGPHISLCSGSHKIVPFNFNKAKIINGKKYDGYLFNCDLIHAGDINDNKDERLVIQYKICHKQDLNKLKHLIGINKYLKNDCNNNLYYDMILRKLSLLFPYITNHVFTKYLQSKQNNIFQKIINGIYKRDFYNM